MKDPSAPGKHPDVYERAVMKNLSGKKFTAAVDLWSMGVTLYHAATGQLPFRPYGGRQNKISMFEIISTKGPGVISGVQKKERGSIEYDTKLPETTWISQGLKDLITPALQELMETNPVKDDQMITFDVFFKRVKDVFLRKVVNLYCASSSTFHKVYLNPGENLAKLQELIAYQTGISAAKQELFHSHERFQPDQMAHADAYPDMTDENPLIIIGGEPIPAEQLAFRRIPNLPKVHRDKTSIDDDANIAKVYANICFVYKTTSETLDCTCKVILKMEGIIGDVLRKEVGDANNFLQHFEEHFKTKNDLIERERKDLDQLKDACRCWSEEIDTDDEKPQTKGADQSYKEFLEKLRSLILWLENGFTCPSFKGLRQKLKTAEWRSTIEKQVNDVKDIFTRFTKDRQLTRRPSNMDDLIHRADKDRLTACVVEIKKQISEVQEYRAALHTKFFEWFGEVWHRKLELERCKQNLEEFAVQYEGRMNSELVRIEGEKKKLFVDIKTKEPQQQQQPQSKQLIDCDRINEELKPLEVLVKEVLKLAEDGHQKLEKTQTLFDQLNSSES